MEVSRLMTLMTIRMRPAYVTTWSLRSRRNPSSLYVHVWKFRIEKPSISTQDSGKKGPHPQALRAVDGLVWVGEGRIAHDDRLERADLRAEQVPDPPEPRASGPGANGGRDEPADDKYEQNDARSHGDKHRLGERVHLGYLGGRAAATLVPGLGYVWSLQFIRHRYLAKVIAALAARDRIAVAEAKLWRR